MVENRRIYLDLIVNSRPVRKFAGLKTYISTGDSDDMDGAEQVSYFNRPSRANVEPKINDVIFAKMANTDKTFLIDEILAKNIYSTGFFDVSTKRIHPRFLYYLIKSDEFNSYKNAYSEGTTQVSISDKRLKSIRVFYETDFATQEKISKYLDKKVELIDLLIENVYKQIKELENLKFNVITNAVSFGVSGGSTKNTNLKWAPLINSKFRIGLIKSDFKLRGRIGWQGLTVQDYVEEGPYLVTGTDFINGSINWNTCVHITEKRYAEDVNIHVKNGDLLITKDGTIGKIAVVTNAPEKVSLNSGIMLIKPKTSRCNSMFLKYVLMSNIFWDWYNFTQRGNATIKHLYQEQFSYFKYPLPSTYEQQEIVNYLDEYIEKIEKLEKIKKMKIEELNKYKNSLIYECVTGKKEVI